MTTPALPEITDAHRRAAFELLAMRGWTFEAAMQDDTRRRVIECRAATLRTRKWRAQHTQAMRPVRRLDPTTGQWRTQRVPGDWISQAGLIDQADQP